MKKQGCIFLSLTLLHFISSPSMVVQAAPLDFSVAIAANNEDVFEIIMIEDAVYPDQVGSITSYSLQGLAVICDSPEDIVASGIGDLSVVWSDGEWGNGGIPADGCRMQPISGFAECYGKTGEYEYVSGSEYISYTVSDELLRSENTVYLLTVPCVLIDNAYWAADYSELLDAVTESESLTLLGAVYGKQTRATLYQNAGRAVVSISEEHTDQTLSVL